jgi:hypothetical protein
MLPLPLDGGHRDVTGRVAIRQALRSGWSATSGFSTTRRFGCDRALHRMQWLTDNRGHHRTGLIAPNGEGVRRCPLLS